MKQHAPQLTALLFLLLALAVHSLAAPTARVDCPRFVDASSGLPTAWEWRTHPALGDVNGDGHLDIAAHPRKATGPWVWIGSARGKWEESSQGLALPGMSCGVGVALGDVNEDTHLDLGVADHCHGVFIFLGDGKGRWRLGHQAPLGDGRGFEDLQFGDLNGDGHLDLIAVGAFDTGFALHLGDGNGNWQRQNMGLPDTGFGRDLKLADINGDGRLDVAAAFTDDIASALPFDRHNNVVWLSQASGGYRRASDGIPTDRQYRGVALGDVNGDDRLDVALTESGARPSTQPLRVYRNAGDGTWKDSSEGLPGPTQGLSFSGVGLADLNADGHADLVALTWLEGALRVWRGDGAGRWHECQETGLPQGRVGMRGHGLSIDDVNGDGKPDLAAGFGRNGQGALAVWIQQ
jgi:hypothetical protein